MIILLYLYEIITNFLRVLNCHCACNEIVVGKSLTCSQLLCRLSQFIYEYTLFHCTFAVQK